MNGVLPWGCMPSKRSCRSRDDVTQGHVHSCAQIPLAVPENPEAAKPCQPPAQLALHTAPYCSFIHAAAIVRQQHYTALNSASCKTSPSTSGGRSLLCTELSKEVVCVCSSLLRTSLKRAGGKSFRSSLSATQLAKDCHSEKAGPAFLDVTMRDERTGLQTKYKPVPPCNVASALVLRCSRCAGEQQHNRNLSNRFI